MSVSMGVVKSNYFSVTDEEAFREYVGKLKSEDTITIEELSQPDGNKKFSFRCHGYIDGYYENEEDEQPEDYIDKLQEHVAEHDAAIVTELGYIGLSDVGCMCYMITRHDLRMLTIPDDCVGIAGMMLGNKEFTTTTQ